MDFNDLLKKPIAKKGPDLFLTPPEHEGIRKDDGLPDNE